MTKGRINELVAATEAIPASDSICQRIVLRNAEFQDLLKTAKLFEELRESAERIEPAQFSPPTKKDIRDRIRFMLALLAARSIET